MAARASEPTPPAGFDFDRSTAADYLGARVSTLHSWAKQKINLPYVMAGGRAWYRKSDCDAYLRRCTRKVEAA